MSDRIRAAWVLLTLASTAALAQGTPASREIDGEMLRDPTRPAQMPAAHDR